MSTHIRNRRKKSFKTTEVREIEQPSSSTAHAFNNKREETSTLNIRRSSRKPKPKKHDDDYVSTEQELAEQAIEGEDVASLKPDGQESAQSSGDRSGVFTGSGIRRETRKTYQNYLETLGYHADFSKISSLGPVQQPGKGKLGFGQRNTVKQSKSNDNPIAKLLFPSNSKSEKTVLAKETSTKVRTSSRTPKPKRTFSLLEDNSHLKYSDSILQNVSDSVETPETKIKSSITDKGKKAPLENHGHKQFKGRRHMASSMAEDSSTTKPLSKQDVDEGHEADVLSDDSSQTRTSTRVRIPKRKFSLIEPFPSMHEAKRLKLMSEEHTSDGEVCEDEGLEDKEPDDGKLQTRSTLVIKRFGGRKQQGNRRGNLRGNTVETDKEKGGDLIKKIDQSHPGSEKKSEGQRGRQRIENEAIVSKLKISKDVTVVKDSKKSKRDKEDEEKTSRKLSKRKRENSDLEKSASEKDEKDIKNDNKEHIVLKLTIPHESPKTEEKGHEKHHHKHHHHHKHKKEKQESENDTKKKKINSDVEVHDVSNSKETSDKDLGVMETVTNVNKKKKKSKEESISESLSSDSSVLPHVKLVIKKSPVKPKDKKEAIKNDHPKITKLSSQTSDEQKNQSDQPNAKVKSKVNKPTSKIKKKRIDKDIKVKAVSAYSLFTKSRRKNLLEREPNLDFASTSRRLADMWKELTLEDKEFWRLKAQAIRKSNKQKADLKGYKGNNLSRKCRKDSDSASKESDAAPSSGTDAVDMAAYLKLLGESLCSIGMCLKRQDQMEVHGSLSVLLDTALCSIVPLFCLTSQLPEMAGCPPITQAQILDNLAYIIPGL